MSTLMPLDPFKKYRDQKKRDKKAKIIEEKIKKITGDNAAGNILGKVAGFLIKNDNKKY
jgi:uncharacterized membrane protein (Fun14 family)